MWPITFGSQKRNNVSICFSLKGKKKKYFSYPKKSDGDREAGLGYRLKKSSFVSVTIE